MHDIDRTQLEGAEPGGSPWGGQELDGELDFDLSEETADYQDERAEIEMDELELATQLLEVATDEEFDQFLGNLVGSAQKLAGRAMRSDTGRALGGILKDAARTALPRVGSAVGQAVVPGATGARFGRAVGKRLTNWLGLELEGLSPEDQEFELARGFVRFAHDASRRALSMPPSVPPRLTAKRAATEAARSLAPSLAPVVAGARTVTPSRVAHPDSGRWVRRGDSIVIHLT